VKFRLQKVNNAHKEKKEMVSACGTMGRSRSAYILLVERPVRKRPLGIPMLRWKDNIKMNLQAVGWGSRD